MDSWSADQLKKMQLGGNKKMNAFFQEYGVPKNTDIVTKYNSRAAEVRRPLESPPPVVHRTMFRWSMLWARGTWTLYPSLPSGMA